jgi:hypothetical protein
MSDIYLRLHTDTDANITGDADFVNGKLCLATDTHAITYKISTTTYRAIATAGVVTGDTLYASAANTWSLLTGNTTTTRKFLRQTGTGTASAAPVWDTLLAADIPDLSATYQPLDADLTAISALSTVGVVTRTAADTWTAGVGTLNRLTKYTATGLVDSLLSCNGTSTVTLTLATAVNPILEARTSATAQIGVIQAAADGGTASLYQHGSTFAGDFPSTGSGGVARANMAMLYASTGASSLMVVSIAPTGKIYFYTSVTENCYMSTAGTVFNDRGDDQDFRIESDTSPYAFCVDGGLNTAGFGAAAYGDIATFGAAAIALKQAITLSDAVNVAVGTTTGTKFGTATDQKIGFYNATPIVQGAAVADATDAASVILRLNDLLARVRATGLIAT